MDKSPLAAVEGVEPAVKSGQHANRLDTFKRVDSVMAPDTQTAAAAATTTTGGEGVRVLELHEWKEAAASLAEAFAEDHTCTYFLSTPDTEHWSKEQKWEIHVKMMEYITYAHLLKGLVVSAGPNYECVALW